MKKIISILLIASIFCGSGLLSASAEGKLSISGIDDKSIIEYGSEITVTATTSTECEGIALFLDGEEYDRAESEEATFILSDILSGRHKVYAVTLPITDVSVKSEEFEFYYITQFVEEIAFDDFEDSSKRNVNWTFRDVVRGSFSVIDESHGYSYVTTHQNGTGTKPAMDATQTLLSKIPSSKFSYEYDFYRESTASDSALIQFYMYNPGQKYLGGVLRPSGTPAISLTNSGPAVRISDKIWYSVKMDVNLLEKTVDVYYKTEDTEMEKLGTIDLASSAVPTRMLIEFDGYGSGVPMAAIDNIRIKATKQSAYLLDAVYYAKGEEYKEYTPANPDKILLPFSTAMDIKTITADNIKVYCADEEVKGSSVSYNADKTGVEISFSPSLPSDTAYKIVVSKDVKTLDKTAQPTDLVYDFKTGFNDFDCKGFLAKVSGAIKSIDEINVGDEVYFEYKIQNTTDEDIEGVMVFVAYEDEALSYINAQNVKVEKETLDYTVKNTLPYVPEEKPDFIEGYFLKDFTNRNCQLKPILLK